MTTELSFQKLADQLSRRAARAFVSKLSPISSPLRSTLAKAFEREPGADGSFLASPVFEPMFGYETGADTLESLAPELLTRSLVGALDRAEEELEERPNRFPATRHPYTHQVGAWRSLLAPEPRSVLVTSGTGSGKTECFLVPVLDSLVRQLHRDTTLVGVQAILLYPLNALINSQRERLSAWTRGFKGQIRYCLYNGQTPQSVPEHKYRGAPEQVLGRDRLRSEPPPILLTNTTMLEYMLIRREDRPILTKSQGRLKWIIVDEAHTYLGSQAAELSLLLRRVMIGFGVRPEDVRFVATSATIGGGEAREQLRMFLADLAGVDPAQVDVVEGRRQVPTLPEDSAAVVPEMPALEALEAAEPEERFEMLVRSAKARELRERVSLERASGLGAIASLWQGGAAGAGDARTLRLLDFMSSARKGDETFLPLRGHLFMRTHGGVWACCNRDCDGRRGTPLEDATWAFGRLYFERRRTCECGARVYELVLCSRCGAEYLQGWEGSDHVLEPEGAPDEPTRDDEDDELEAEADEEDLAEEEVHRPANRRLLGRRRLRTNPVAIEPMSGKLIDKGDLGLAQPDPQNNGRLQCPACGESEGADSQIFWPLRAGAPFFLGVGVPALLELSPPMPGDRIRPLGGRRTLSFTDSRQGSARFAARAQAEAERNYFRSWLYHQLWANMRRPDEVKVARLKKGIVALEEVAATNPALAAVLENQRTELATELEVKGGALSWGDAVKDFASNAEAKWMAADWKRKTGAEISEQDMARYCLYREFLRRPRRYNSLETLGLAGVAYPEIDKVSAAPTEWRVRGKSLAEWRQFLRICLDFILRGYGAIRVNDGGHDFVRWMGAPKPRVMLSPDDVSQKNLPAWPQLRGGGLPRVALLLEVFLEVDRATNEGKQTINDILREAWEVLRSRQIIRQQQSGVNLDLEAHVEFRTIKDGWLCPVTRRVLATTLGGLTPYIAPGHTREQLRCQTVVMPDLRFPHRLGGSRVASLDEINAWLERDPEIGAAREAGIWTEFSDRLATRADFFRADEHSAQRSGWDLARMEEQFKSGELNLLSCSTTMEMGVDIGGLSAVAMNNAPPGPANFLQRAGRAGRRGESRAASLTLCKATPHGEAVFRNPMWPFDMPIHVPRVALESARIVQRHVNALAFGMYMGVVTQEAHRLKAGPFFLGDAGTAPVEKLLDWLAGEEGVSGALATSLRRLVQRSALAGVEPGTLLEATQASLREAWDGWRQEDEAITLELEAVGGWPPQGDANPAQLALSRQRLRLRKEYLLRELVSRRFLPGYGFPTEVVPFIHTNIDDLKAAEAARKRQQRDEEESGAADETTAEDRFGQRAEYPSRSRDIAMREYAPGSDLVIGGKVFRSGGLTMSWHIPPGDKTIPEVQAMRWAWACGQCGSTGTHRERHEACPACGEAKSLRARRYLLPAGFAVEISSKPHGDLASEQYIPVIAPWISAGGAEWSPLADGNVGRHRYGADGEIFQGSSGIAGHGYAICLRCGLADSETSGGLTVDTLPKRLQGHRPLRGGKQRVEEGRQCVGNEQPFAIQRGLWLGQSSLTDVYELQLTDPRSGRPMSEVEAYSIAVAMRQALSEKLGIDERELGVATTSSQYASSARGFSVLLFDKAAGGAGYAAAAPGFVAELLTRAREILRCPKDCDQACHRCLLSYDTQHQHRILDRRRALALLDEGVVDALALPGPLRLWGERTQFEYLPIGIAVRREAARGGASSVAVYLAGDATQWDLDAWALRRDMYRWLSQDLRLVAVIPDGFLDRLAESERQILASWARNGVRLIRGAGADAKTLVCVGGETWVTRWATTEDGARTPGGQWGAGEGGAARNVLVRELQPFEEPNGVAITADELMPTAEAWGDLREITVRGQLDGALSGVGARFWDHLRSEVPELDRRLRSAVTLKEVRYTDRYIRSPLNARVLFNVLDTLKGLGVTEETRFVLQTAEVRRDSARYPREWGDDWTERRDQEAVLEGVMGLLKGKADVDIRPTRDLTHARELALTWEDGASWELRLDQGLTFLEPARREEFPFARPATEQVAALRTRSFNLRRRDQGKVYLYAKEVGR